MSTHLLTSRVKTLLCANNLLESVNRFKIISKFIFIHQYDRM